MGVDFAKAALAAGHAVVPPAGPRRRAKAVGKSEDLLVVKLDVPTAPTPRRRRGPPSPGSAASTCWSTMLATSLAGYFGS